MEAHSNTPTQSSGRARINSNVGNLLRELKIGKEQIDQLTQEQVKILNYPSVRYALRNQLISLEDIGNPIRMSTDHKIILDNDKTVTICGQEVNLLALLNACDANVKLLDRDVIKSCLSEKMGTINDVLEADLSKGCSLGLPIRCVREGIQGITLKQALEISAEKSHDYTWPTVNGEYMTAEQETLFISGLKNGNFAFSQLPELKNITSKELEQGVRSGGIKDPMIEKESSVIDPKNVAKGQENRNMSQEESAKKEKATGGILEELAKPRLKTPIEALRSAIEEDGLPAEQFMKTLLGKQNYIKCLNDKNPDSKEGSNKNIPDKFIKNNAAQSSGRGRS